MAAKAYLRRETPREVVLREPERVYEDFTRMLMRSRENRARSDV